MATAPAKSRPPVNASQSLFAKLSLRQKILATLSFILLLMLAITLTSLWNLGRQREASGLALSRLSNAKDARDVIQYSARSYQTQADTIINLIADGKDFAEEMSSLSKSIDRLASLADTPPKVEQSKRIRKAWTEYDALYRKDILPRVVNMIANSNSKEKQRLMEELREADSKADDILSGMRKDATDAAVSFEQEASAAALENDAMAAKVRVLMISLAVGSLFIGVILSLLMAYNLSRSLNLVADELAKTAEQTVSAAGQVSSASQTLAEGASEQAASLEESSASLEEMAGMTRRNGENTQQASELSGKARLAAETGASDMQEMSAAMNEIKKSSDDIGAIIKTIDEIAFQTNILALNAAVEAARAGEAGAGFAVVADEVRNLAQRAAAAARETSGKIEGAIQKTTQGVQINARVATGLGEILEQIRKVDALMTEVSSASKEQTQGIEQLNVAMNQMDKVTQANASSAEESAAAAEELNGQAGSTQAAVGTLMQIIHGG